MHTLLQTLIWFWRAWPVLVVAVLGALHFLALNSLPTHTTDVNKMTGTVMQIVGVLFILHSINDNLGAFRSQSIRAVVVAWFRDFPPLRRSVTIALSGNSCTLSPVARGTMSLHRDDMGIEERVAEIERQIAVIITTLSDQDASLRKKIDEFQTALTQRIAVTQSTLSSQLERATVGGFKQQSFGVLLAIYGAIVSVFA